MKKTINRAFIAVISLLLILCFASCGAKQIDAEGLWADATYLKDTELGKGAKTLVCEVAVEDKKVTFTVHTDKDTVGAALIEHGVIAGDEGPYGLYIKQVNGITADFDVDQSYWSFYINGEYAMTGADMTEIKEDAVYRFEYAK